MSQSEQKPPYPVIFRAINDGKVIPFLGAGASIAWGLDYQGEKRPKTTPELARHLARWANFSENLSEGEINDLAKISEYYDLYSGRDQLNQTLNDEFNQDFLIPPLHKFLAKIKKPLLIITTNYDDLIERAFNLEGRPYNLVVHTTEAEYGGQILLYEPGSKKAKDVSPKNLDLDVKSVAVIYKMHGAVDRSDTERGQYVITENDYIEFITRMTQNTAIPNIFAEPFQTRPFLFLGYSLRDWNFRVVLNRIQDVRSKIGLKSWAIQRQPTDMEKTFWIKRDVMVYSMGLEKFVKDFTSLKKKEGDQ